MFSRWICALLLVAMSAAQNVPPSAHAAGFRLVGTVVHSVTGQPLPQIQLSIIRAQTPDVLQAVNSDDAGHFVFSVLRPGKYVLVAQGRGFPWQAWDEHNGFSTAAVVGPGKDSESVIFRVRPESSISGVVTDEANEPVRDAQVMLFHRASEEGNNLIHLREQVSTNDQGRYHFAHLFPGAFFVAVTAQPWYAQSPVASGAKKPDPLDVAYPVTYYSGTMDANAATPIVIRPGEKISADLSLAPAPALQLEVTGLARADGSTALSATHKVFGQVSIGASSRTEGRGDGRTFITGLPPGEVEINSISPGNPRSSWKQSLNLSASGSLKGTPQSQSASVAGKVVLGETKFRSSWISLTDRKSGERNQTSVNPDGSFQFSDSPIRPGTYQIGVYNLPGAILASIVASGAKVDGRTIEIGPGAAVTLTLLMSKGAGQIDGTALQNGKPSPGAMIVLIPQDLENNQSRIRRDQSDSDGTFTLPQIAPGRYTVLALQNGWDLEWQNPAVLKPYLKLGQPIFVGPNHRYETKINVQ